MPVIDVTLDPIKTLEILIDECGPEKFEELTGQLITQKVRKSMQCWLTGKPLTHEAICHYCGRCPAGRWFKVERRHS